MFDRRPQSWTPLDDGDLATSALTHGDDHWRPDNGPSAWYPKAAPDYEAISTNDYEMIDFPRHPDVSNKSGNAAVREELDLLSDGKQDDYQRYPHEETRIQRMRRNLSGWRAGLMMSASCTGTVLLINVTSISWASSKFEIQNGYGKLVYGECSKTKTASLWIHLAINVLSTLLLSASNYCMQILTAPTRPEIDRAHAKGVWLDIGVPSVHNLRYISSRRVWLWVCLALSSLPLHLLYNSAVFDTISGNEYNIYMGSDQIQSWNGLNVSLLHDDLALPSTSAALLEKAQQNLLERLDNKACIQAYGRDFVSDRGDVILIMEGITSTNLSFVENSRPNYLPHDWICESQHLYHMTCYVNKVAADADNWVFPVMYYDYVPVSYCLSEKTAERCQLQFSVNIMIFVIVANLAKLLCMLYTVWSHRIPTMVTAGDAIASFLQHPDPTTVGKCTLSKRNVAKEEKWAKRTVEGFSVGYRAVSLEPQRWDGKHHRWFSAASKTRWTVCYVFCIATIVIAGFLEGMGEVGLRLASYPTDIKSLWNLGFGAVSAVSLVHLSYNDNDDAGIGIVGNILLANAAQVVLSFLYLSYNSIFTCKLLSQEWTSYTQKRKALRVTSPTGLQRSTYFLQLPYTYSVPLIACSGLLHWLVSQSIFLARVVAYDEFGNVDSFGTISTCGYSCIAIIFVLAVGSLLITAGFLNGFRKYPGNIPLAATCSAAISAACHPPADDKDAAFKEVQYGEVEINNHDGIRHCTFTSHPVTTPIAGELYA